MNRLKMCFPLELKISKVYFIGFFHKPMKFRPGPGIWTHGVHLLGFILKYSLFVWTTVFSRVLLYRINNEVLKNPGVTLFFGVPGDKPMFPSRKKGHPQNPRLQVEETTKVILMLMETWHGSTDFRRYFRTPVRDVEVSTFPKKNPNEMQWSSSQSIAVTGSVSRDFCLRHKTRT